MPSKKEKQLQNNEIIKAMHEALNAAQEPVLRSIEEIKDSQQVILSAMHAYSLAIEGRITMIEATMVTKDYLDDKMADLRGDLVCLVKKEDKKVNAIVEKLKTKKIISKVEGKGITSMGPFGRTA